VCWGIEQVREMVNESHLWELDSNTRQGMVDAGTIDPLLEKECPYHNDIKSLFVDGGS